MAGVIAVLVLSQAGIDWAKDFEAAQAAAKAADRRVMAHFQLKGRPLCRAMDEETFTDGAVAAACARFVCVKIDIEAQPALFDRAVGGRGGLGTAILDGTGDVVSVLPGYAGPQGFLLFLEKAEQGYPALKAAKDAAGGGSGPYALAELYRELDSARRAEECYRKAIEGGEPKWAALSHERLARMRVNRGKNVEARRHLEEYRKLDAEDRFGASGRALLTEALAFNVERKYPEAIHVLEEGLKKNPDGEEADLMVITVGIAEHELGRLKEAQKALEGMLGRYPKSRWAPLAREMIEHIKKPPPDHPH